MAGAPNALNTLKELSDALGLDANFSTTVVTELGKKAPKESPTFTGTVTIPTMTFNGTDLQTTLNNKAPKQSPIFTGTVTIPTLTFNNADLQTTLDNKAPKANPTLTGTVKVNAIDVIPNADNTIPDLNVTQSLEVGTAVATQELKRARQLLRRRDSGCRWHCNAG